MQLRRPPRPMGLSSTVVGAPPSVHPKKRTGGGVGIAEYAPSILCAERPGEVNAVATLLAPPILLAMPCKAATATEPRRIIYELAARRTWSGGVEAVAEAEKAAAEFKQVRAEADGGTRS